MEGDDDGNYVDGGDGGAGEGAAAGGAKKGAPLLLQRARSGSL